MPATMPTILAVMGRTDRHVTRLSITPTSELYSLVQRTDLGLDRLELRFRSQGIWNIVEELGAISNDFRSAA